MTGSPNTYSPPLESVFPINSHISPLFPTISHPWIFRIPLRLFIPNTLLGRLPRSLPQCSFIAFGIYCHTVLTLCTCLRSLCALVLRARSARSLCALARKYPLSRSLCMSLALPCSCSALCACSLYSLNRCALRLRSICALALRARSRFRSLENSLSLLLALPSASSALALILRDHSIFFFSLDMPCAWSRSSVFCTLARNLSFLIALPIACSALALV